MDTQCLDKKNEVDMGKNVDTKKYNNIFESRFQLVRVSREIDQKKRMLEEMPEEIKKDLVEKDGISAVEQKKRMLEEMLEEIKKDLLKKDGISADDLSNVTTINLISLMEDKGIISMENCAYLESIFDRMDQKDLKEILPGKCKYFLCCYSIKSYFFAEGCFKLFVHFSKL